MCSIRTLSEPAAFSGPRWYFFYLSNEGVSLLENAAYLGLPVPAKLKAVLEQLHDRAEKSDIPPDGKDGDDDAERE